MSTQKREHGCLLASLFIIAKTWKKPRCPSVGEWINKLWYIQKMEYYSVQKQMSYQIMKRDLNPKCVLLSKRSQPEKATHL